MKTTKKDSRIQGAKDSSEFHSNPGTLEPSTPIVHYYVFCQHKWNRSSAQISLEVCEGRQSRNPKKCLKCKHFKQPA